MLLCSQWTFWYFYDNQGIYSLEQWFLFQKTRHQNIFKTVFFPWNAYLYRNNNVFHQLVFCFCCWQYNCLRSMNLYLIRTDKQSSLLAACRPMSMHRRPFWKVICHSHLHFITSSLDLANTRQVMFLKIFSYLCFIVSRKY